MPELEGLRGLAAISVFAYHLWFVLGAHRLELLRFPTSTILSKGSVGVDLFFVLSGFLLALPWLRGYQQGQRPAWRTYARRRLYRIVPAYYASIVILAVWTPPPPPGFDVPAVTPAVLVAHALFAHYLALSPALDGVYWSLSTEMQFYIVLPLLALGFSVRRWRYGLAGCVVAALVWRVAVYHVVSTGSSSFRGVDVNFYLNTVLLPGRLDAFAVGMTTAVLWLWYRDRVRPFARFGASLLGIALIVVALGSEDSAWLEQGRPLWWVKYLFQHTLIAFGFGLIIIGALSGAVVMAHVWRSWPLRRIGTISYSMYLWHLPLTTAIVAWFGGTGEMRHGLPLALGIVAAVVLVSTLSYICVERPFLDGGIRFKATLDSGRERIRERILAPGRRVT